MGIGSKKQLAVLLSKLKVFEHPHLSLEQYPTDGEIAATILWDAHMQGEIDGKIIADFGCGTGILGIGALALGAKHVVFIEVDSKLFPLLIENLKMLEDQFGHDLSNYEIINGHIESFDRQVDLILQNPPFGTQEKHADMMFVKQAVKLAPIVYSLHKTSTQEYLKQWAQQSGVHIANIMHFDFPLKQSMPHHQKRIQRIEVSCFKFVS
jgi:putative methylase